MASSRSQSLPHVAAVASDRVRRTHLPEMAGRLGMSVRAADVRLHLDGGTTGLLDTTHFDTVRFPPPEWAEQEMRAAIADGCVAYTPYRGNQQVLDALAASVGAFLGCSLSTANIALAAGTQAALFATLSSLVNEGDLVLLADPDYLFCERMLAFLGARIERVPVRHAAGEATLDLSAVSRLLPLKPRLLLFSHPNNPTGAVYSSQMLDELAELAVKGDFIVVVDELYARLVYDDTPFVHLLSLPGMADRCVTVLGPSKTESMSGFRVGIAVGPTAVMEAVEQCIALTSLRAPGYAQQLLRRWLVDDEKFVRGRVRELHALQHMTVSRLRQIPGISVTPQMGTAYLFPDATGVGLSDVELAHRLQHEAGVIVSPGYQFGPAGVGHFRVCYARDEDEWAAALDRIVGCLTAAARDPVSPSTAAAANTREGPVP